MCCAADASALMVEPVGATPVEADTWVAVEGEWLPSGASIDDRPSEMPRLRVTSLEPAERPREPYESAADVPRG